MRDHRAGSWSRVVLFGVTLLAMPLGCVADARDDEPELGQSAQAITADSIMARAKEWVTDKVLYCSVSNHKYDSVCGYTCNRPTAAWDAYRSDCSGFVSWCWQLASQPSSRTYMVDKTGTDGWKTIPIDSLSAGDALVCNGHIMLFSRWVTSTSFEIYQESNCGKVANFGTRTFKRNADGTLLVGTDTRVYHPIRRNGVTTAAPDAGPTDAAKPDAPSEAASDAVSDGSSADAEPIDAEPIDAGAPDPGALPDDGELPGDDGAEAPMTGSCSVGSSSSGAALGWLGSALLLLATRARRRRRS